MAEVADELVENVLRVGGGIASQSEHQQGSEVYIVNVQCYVIKNQELRNTERKQQLPKSH